MSHETPLDRETLLDVYRKMRTIRDFEERLHIDFSGETFRDSCICMPERKP